MTYPALKSMLPTLVLLADPTTTLAQNAHIPAPHSGTPPPKPTTPSTAPSGLEQWLTDAKKPASWLTVGGDLRIRNEYYNNIVTLSSDGALNEQDVVRFRGRFWASANVLTNLSVNARLAAEPRLWAKPAFTRQVRGQEGMEWRYGLVDNANVKWNNPFDLPMTLTVGRQDITIGEFWNWWLFADGTPADGSWSYFLDAARVTYELKDIKTRFDTMYIYQSARPGEWLPTFDNSSDYNLTEQNEQGAALFITNKSIKDTALEGFFVYKGDDQEFANGDNADIYTLGGKLSGNPGGGHWSYSLEGAYQFGTKQDPTVRGAGQLDRDISAYGANARVSYLFKDPLNNQAHLVYEYLSGDDPDTQDTDEMFDVLWGRWPRWSELYIYSYANETSGKIAQLNNIQRVGAGWTMAPIKNTHFGAYYNALFAPESVPTRALQPSLFSNDGNFRGHYLQSVLTHTFSKHLKGHLWAEFVWQGDYYTSDDLLSFLRAEITMTW